MYNLFSDQTPNAVSYVEFRKILAKKVKQGNKEFELNNLDKDISYLLNEYRNKRNWVHHVPQSLFNSQIDYMETESKIPKKLIEQQYSTELVYVLEWEYHEIKWLQENYKNAIREYEQLRKIFQFIKKDYSKLVGESIYIIKQQQEDPRPFKFSEIAEKSYEINTKPNRKI